MPKYEVAMLELRRGGQCAAEMESEEWEHVPRSTRWAVILPLGQFDFIIKSTHDTMESAWNRCEKMNNDGRRGPKRHKPHKSKTK